MKLAYIVNARIPTEKAHGYQISKMCSEFAKAGADVTLFFPDRRNDIGKDLFEYYGIEKNFNVVAVRCLDAVRFAPVLRGLAFVIQTKLFLKALKAANIDKETVVYTRNPEVASEYYKKGNRVFYDAHNFPEKDPARIVNALRGVSGIVANSSGTARAFKEAGFERVLVAHNGVDISEFDVRLDSREARARMGLRQDAKIAMYVGHLYAWKGIDLVVEAAVRLPDVLFAVVGGTKKDILKYENIKKARNLANVYFLGHRARKDIPVFLRAADVLLLPNAAVSAESEKYTSPLKMFEYMASSTPIVASDLPSMREVLDQNTATFFAPGDAGQLISAIERVLGNASEGMAKARLARIKAEGYTWDNRAKAILNFIKG
ncbi:MAG TPA: glycosyltransferase [Candidatus Paceibacterota bacterium]